ncbi:conserved hypothetical protein [Coccidioides posadasii str. Silveira]|uniref:Uncharacterized protein n=1 Tax=Coccidioides posadasii (strain RMSCC 757 / Silveira) TaxID=443226 RepID=E9D152_COCPS|nr:conserved hypothetical protein [Coccidioides posadasii str. Silveira]
MCVCTLYICRVHRTSSSRLTGASSFLALRANLAELGVLQERAHPAQSRNGLPRKLALLQEPQRVSKRGLWNFGNFKTKKIPEPWRTFTVGHDIIKAPQVEMLLPNQNSPSSLSVDWRRSKGVLLARRCSPSTKRVGLVLAASANRWSCFALWVAKIPESSMSRTPAMCVFVTRFFFSASGNAISF